MPIGWENIYPYSGSYDSSDYADRWSASQDARATGNYQYLADVERARNFRNKEYAQIRNVDRWAWEDEQKALQRMNQVFQGNAERANANSYYYEDPVTGKNLGMNPFPQSEYTPEQLGLTKVDRGVKELNKSTAGPNMASRILQRDRDFQANTPTVPRWGDAARQTENPAWGKWYTDRGKNVPGYTPPVKTNQWEEPEPQPTAQQQIIDEQPKPTWGKIGADVTFLIDLLSKMHPSALPFTYGNAIASAFKNMPRTESPQRSGPKRPVIDPIEYFLKLIGGGNY